MENDWDLKLLQEMEPDNDQSQNKGSEPDLMLQPITTQQKFNVKNKGNDQASSSKKISDQMKKFMPFSNQAGRSQVSDNEKNLLNQQSRKFRQYLSQKVDQLRKSRQFIAPDQTSPSHYNWDKKSTTLRKIVNHQEQNMEVKKQNAQFNLQKPHRQNATKESGDKRYANSHSSLAKNASQNPTNLQANHLTDIKKSLNLQNIDKFPKLPNSTPNAKIPLPIKNQVVSAREQKIKINTIDVANSKELAERQKDIKQTPGSKNSFRIKRTSNAQQKKVKVSVEIRKPKQVSLRSIQKQGKSKKIREDFMKLNQEERNLQQQILKNHQDNKKFIQKILKKYEISSEEFQKYGIKKDIQGQIILAEQKQTASPQKKQARQSRVQRSSQKQINAQISKKQEKTKQSSFKKQQQRNKLLEEDIQKINTLLKQKDKQRKKSESRVEKNPLMRFLKQQPEDIQQEPEQDEADIVEQLPIPNANKPYFQGKDFSSTYSSVMSEMKNKKWGLKQRITFETHRQPLDNKSDSRHAVNADKFSFHNQKRSLTDLPSQYNIVDQSERLNNKIEVNSRLRNLLID